MVEPIKTILKIGGLLSTFVIWVMEERSTGYAIKFIQRLKELEWLMGYNQWRGRKSATEAIFSATNAVRLFYLAGAIFWFFTIMDD